MKSKFGEALILLKKGQLEQAKNIFSEILNDEPNNFNVYNNIGNISFLLGNLDDALQNYENAIKLKPDFADVYNNRGNVLSKLNKKNDAIESYQKATKLNPNSAGAYKNLGSVFREVGDIHNAIRSYQKAIEIKPNYFEAFLGLGNTYLGNGQSIFALNNYEKILKLKPNFDFLLGTITHVKFKICKWDTIEKNLREIEEKVLNQEKISMPWIFITLSNSPKLQKICADTWSKKEVSDYKNIIKPIQKNKPNKKIRIGYYSADFHEHVMSFLLAKLFELHNKSKFELIAFSFGPEKIDEMQKRISKSFDQFINVNFKSDNEISQLSRDLKIDIAVDLMGFTRNNRFKIFVQKCAPIQVNYLGYPGTSGANFFDYIVADRTLIPKENQEHYSEKIIYLPNTWLPRDFTQKISDKVFTRKELDLPKEGFIFCSFNQSYKITPDVFNIWMRLLKKIEGSVLWLLEDDQTAKINLKKEASKRGIDINRIIFAKKMRSEEHLARLKIADLWIDTFPYTAQATCADALWSGLPVLTRKGKSFTSRGASSILSAIGLNELITDTEKKYEETASKLAKNPEFLKKIKNKLEKNRLTKPLFDTKLYTKNLEKAYTNIYNKYQSNLPAENIEIN